MTVEITIQVPDTLEHQLRDVQDRLPEVLERGLREVLAEQEGAFADENAVLAMLATQPTPAQILELHPTDELQARVSDLLYRSKQDQLTSVEEAELERYFVLEHLVRLAKAHAQKQSS